MADSITQRVDQRGSVFWDVVDYETGLVDSNLNTVRCAPNEWTRGANAIHRLVHADSLGGVEKSQPELSTTATTLGPALRVRR